MDQKEMNEPVYIYGYQDRGVFLYVGQTVELSERHQWHIAKKPKLKGLQMVVLRKTTFSNCDRIERQIIANLQRRGQCKLNKRIPFDSAPKVGGAVVLCETTGAQFASVAQAVRVLGCNDGELKSSLKLIGYFDFGKHRLRSPAYLNYVRNKDNPTPKPRKEK